VEDLVVEDLLEDCPRGRVVVHDFAVDGEATGGRFFGDVQECEQPIVRLPVDLKIFEAVAAGQRAGVEETIQPRAACPQQGGAPLTEEVAVMQFVDRVRKIQAPQQRILRRFGGAQDVAAAIGLHLGKCEQLPHAPIEVSPHPSVEGPHDAIDAGCPSCRHRGGRAAYGVPPITRTRVSQSPHADGADSTVDVSSVESALGAS
jgi:hypothetical protein